MAFKNVSGVLSASLSLIMVASFVATPFHLVMAQDIGNQDNPDIVNIYDTLSCLPGDYEQTQDTDNLYEGPLANDESIESDSVDAASDEELLIPPVLASTDEEAPSPYVDTAQIQVNELDGSFSYTYPIVTPPGRNGLTPSLALSFSNSDRQHGALFGYGWSLSLPSISRLNKKGVDKLYTDNYFSSSLDGELVKISTSNNIETYAPRIENGNFFKYQFNTTTNAWTIRDKAGTRYDLGQTAQSRQDDPADSARIYMWLLDTTTDMNNNTISYDYYKEAGQMYPDTITYNNDELFRVEFNRVDRPIPYTSYKSQFKVTNNYRIDTIETFFDNQKVASYNLTIDNQQLKEIQVTGFDESGEPTEGEQTVFIYADEEGDTEFVFSEDFTRSLSHGYNSSAQGHAFRNINDQDSALVDINGDGLTDYITTASYYTSNNPDDYDSGVYLNTGTEFVFSEDFTRSLSHGYNSSAQGHAFRNINDQDSALVDINGDGLTDYITTASYYTSNNPDDYDSGVYLNTGTEFVFSEDFTRSLSHGYNSSAQGHAFRNINDQDSALVDINGDGLTDYITTASYYTSNNPDDYDSGVYLNTGTEFVFSEDFTRSLSHGYNSSAQGHAFRNINDQDSALVDINGDGLTDYITTASYYTSNNPDDYDSGVYLNTGTEFVFSEDFTRSLSHGYNSSAQGHAFRNINDQDSALVDINGDGLTDYITTASYYTSNNPDDYDSGVYLNTGTEFVFSEDFTRSLSHGYNSSAQGHAFRNINDQDSALVDINGDGLTDYITTASYYTSNNPDDYDSGVYLNTGTEFVFSEDFTRSLSHGYNSSAQGHAFRNINDQDSALVDINGDGLTDYITTASYYTSNNPDDYDSGVYLNTGNRFSQISTITNSSKGQSELEYTDARRQDVSNFTKLKINVVVDTVTANDNNGNQYTTSYNYKNAEDYFNPNDPHDKRFSGFGEVTVSDGFGKTTTHFHQGNGEEGNEPADSYAKIGKVWKTESFDSNDTLLVNGLTTHIGSDIGIDPITNTIAQSILPNQSVTTTYTPNGDTVAQAVSYTYDSFGNKTDVYEYGSIDPDEPPSSTNVGPEYRHTNTQYAYNVYDNISVPHTVTLSDSNDEVISEVKYFYDNESHGSVEEGNMTKESTWMKNSDWSDQRYEYLANGLLDKHINSHYGETSYTYDGFSLYPETILNPGYQSTNYTYDYSSGQPTSITDDNNTTVESSYDGLDRLVQTRQSTVGNWVKTIEEYEYVTDVFPQSTIQTTYLSDSNSYKNIAYTDGFGQLIQSKKEDESGFVTTNTSYDARGRVTHQTLPYFTSDSTYTDPGSVNPNLVSVTTYDALDRPVLSSNVSGITQTQYDGYITTITDPENMIKDYVYDAFGRLTEVHEHNESSEYVTKYDWTPHDQLVKITDAQNNVRNFKYNGRGQKTYMSDIHRLSDTNFNEFYYDYDTEGNMITMTSDFPVQISYLYDSLNRLVTEHNDTDDTTYVTNYYDSCDKGIGKLCSIETPNVTESFTYTSSGDIDVHTVSDGNNKTFSTNYDYDFQGNVIMETYPGWTYSETNYNTYGQPSGVSFINPFTSTNALLVDNITYGPHGQPTVISHGNGVTTTYDYDENDLYRLKNKTTTDDTDSVIEMYEYDYDNVGNIVDVEHTAGVHTRYLDYTYDDLYRLTHVSNAYGLQDLSPLTWTYEYDSIGNMTYNSRHGNYHYTGSSHPHAPSTINLVPINYDSHGNVMSVGFDRTYSWNYRNELTEGQTVITGDLVTNDYKSDSTRFKETIDNGATIFYPTPSFTYTTPNVPGDENDISTTNISINAGALPIATISIAPNENETNPELETTVLYTHTNHLNSSTLLTDTDGETAETRTYQPYGDILTETTTNTPTNPLPHNSNTYTQRKFSNHIQDEHLGVTDMGKRYYHAYTTRFISQDPANLRLGTNPQEMQQLLMDPQQQNLYSYARNNPVTFVDLEGESIDHARGIWGSIESIPTAIYESAKFTAGTAVDSIPAAFGNQAAQARNDARGDSLAEGFYGLVDTYVNYSQMSQSEKDFIQGAIIGEVIKSAITKKVGGINTPNRSGFWTPGEPGAPSKNVLTHANKHGHEFGFTNAKQYVDHAHDFFDNPPAGTQIKTRQRDGASIYFHSKSNTFGVMNEHGVPQTLYRPANDRVNGPFDNSKRGQREYDNQ